MKGKWLKTLVALGLCIALATPLWSKPVTRDIKICQPVKFGPAQFDAGEYRLRIDGTKVAVFHKNKQVAELEGRWELRETRPRHDSYVLNRRGELEEVRFAGDNRVLILVHR
jgi:hypothetical protein